MVAFIFDAEAEEHPPPPVLASVALLGSILRTDATALSIREGILENDRNVRVTAEDSMRVVGATWHVRCNQTDDTSKHRSEIWSIRTLYDVLL
jgi:hypothetical protein